MQIAGVNFSLSHDQSLAFNNPPATYRQFLANTAPFFDLIRISLVMDDFPDTGKMIRIFESNQSWSLFVKDGDYFLEYRPPAFHKPFWVAHFDSRLEKATVHCGEMLTGENNGVQALSNPLYYPLDQLLLMYKLARRTGVIVHAAGLNILDKGYIFPGRSGAGKSTLSRLFLGRDTIGMLSDDRVAVRKIGGIFNLFGTPWAGDAGIAENKRFPLSGIFFIQHGGENMIKQILPKEAMEKLMPVTTIPWYDRDIMPDILASCDELVCSVPAYELSFRPGSAVVDFFEKFVSA
jgi:hypothetical protein